ncbi:hypothetical protein ERN12_06265 [Rhodobacteraceae bacterium]|nr:hypothetical protein ERN12_06265 [Paracoccaceae bacterium]
MMDDQTPSDMAALSICETLHLALRDADILSAREIRGLLVDAATTHDSATGSQEEIGKHRDAAVLIRRIIAGSVSLCRS